MNGDRTLDWMLAEWPDSSPEDVADALWLAALGVVEVASADRGTGTPPPAPPGTKAIPPPPPQVEPPPPKPPEQPRAPPPVASGESRPAEGELVLPSVDTTETAMRSTAGRGIVLRVPGARALPGSAALLRSLRPLRRRVESRRQLSLDIEATINRIAGQGLWMPVMRSARARWLDLALVIEDSRTMVLWRETLRELRRVLEQSGAFRDVRVWWLDSANSAGPVLRVQPDGAPCQPRELIAADGRRAVLVATDCLSPGWSSGALAGLLRQWGARQPVALLQMLPRHLWSRTALYHATIVHAGASQPGLPNRQLQRQTALGPIPSTPPPGMVIPVLTTEPEFVAAWAKLVGSGNPPEIPGVIFPAASTSQSTAAAKESPKPRARKPRASEKAAPAPEAQIREFRQLASPLAFRLASLLAAAPLRLPVMRLVQRTLLPESGQVHLAEVFLGGLVKRISPTEKKGTEGVGGIHRVDPDLVDYDFQPGVRSLLLDAARVDDAAEVQTRVSEYLADRFGQRLDFRGMLKSPEKSGDLADFQENSEFARVSAEVLRRMGKKYAQVARRLEAASGPVLPVPEAPAEVAAAPTSPVSDSKQREEAAKTPPSTEADPKARSPAERPRPLSPEREEKVRAFLKEHQIFRRFANEENDANQLLDPTPSDFAWKLLWAELWREAGEDGAWTLVVQFIDAAIGTGYVQVFRAGEGRLTRVASLVRPGGSDYDEASLSGIIGRAARTAETVLVPDVTDDPKYISAETSTRSELAIPIPLVAANANAPLRAAGVINIESPRLNAFWPVQVGWLEQVAGSLTNYLGWVAAFRRTRRSRRRGFSILQGEPLFNCFSEDQLTQIVNQARLKLFGRGKPVIEESAAGDSMFVMLRGAAKVFVSKNGMEIQVATLGPGHSFGEMSLLTGEPRSSTVRADGYCYVMEIGKPVMAKVVSGAPSCLEQLSRLLARRKMETEGTLKEAESIDDYALKERQYTANFQQRLRTFFQLDPSVAATPPSTEADPKATSPAGRPRRRTSKKRLVPTIHAHAELHALLNDGQREQLEKEILPDYFQNCRWFGSKRRTLRHLRVIEQPGISSDADAGRLWFVEVSYLDGPTETFALPVKIASGDVARAVFQSAPEAIIARFASTEETILMDAIWDAKFRSQLFEVIAEGQIIKGRGGDLVGVARKTLRPGHLVISDKSNALADGQSNSSMLFDNKFFLKFYRKLEDGVNPDVEINRFLTERADFPNVPAFLGSIEYRRPKADPTVVCLLQSAVTNEGDVWTLTVDAIGRYYQRVLERKADLQNETAQPGALSDELFGGVYPEKVKQMGQRTGELHLALASGMDDPAFAPEPFNASSVYQNMRALLRHAFTLLEKKLLDLSQSLRDEAKAVLAAEEEILGREKRLLDRRTNAVNIRIHGDYHLGQLIYTGKDFVIIDFEGEPAHPLSDRKMKRSALRDVAGMMRSFQYAAYAALWAPAMRREDVPFLERWADLWYRQTSSMFLQSYLNTTSRAIFIPKNSDDLQIMLEAHLLDKAVYELGYELNNRPSWVLIPIRGIKHILQTA